jgi:hypothetical protein
MSWQVRIHKPSIFVGILLQGQDRKFYLSAKNKIDIYYNQSRINEGYIKDILAIWIDCGNAVANLDDSIPVCRQIIKYIRYRLCDNEIGGFLRLIHLINVLMRNGGIRAHVLIGRKRFLQTITYFVARYKKNASPLYKETANFTFQCLRDWAAALKERQDMFPYYQSELKALVEKCAGFEVSEFRQFTVVPLELAPIKIDPAYRFKNLEASDDDYEKIIPQELELSDVNVDSRSVVESRNESEAVKEQIEEQKTEVTKEEEEVTAVVEVVEIVEIVTKTEDVFPDPVVAEESSSAGVEKRAELQQPHSGTNSENSQEIVHMESEALTSRDVEEEDEEDSVIPDAVIGNNSSMVEIEDRPFATVTERSNVVGSKHSSKELTNKRVESVKFDIPLVESPKAQQKSIACKSDDNSVMTSPSGNKRHSTSTQNFEVKFYGNQRVVVSKKDVFA